MANCLDCGGTECICRSNEIIQKLTEACQIFTTGLGCADGYYPNLGAPKTHKAIQLMKEAGVEPVFYGDDKEDIFGDHLVDEEDTQTEMRAAWKDASSAGSCNFCNNYSSNRVLEVNGCHLIVRFCPDCLKSLSQQSK